MTALLIFGLETGHFLFGSLDEEPSTCEVLSPLKCWLDLDISSVYRTIADPFLFRNRISQKQKSSSLGALLQSDDDQCSDLGPVQASANGHNMHALITQHQGRGHTRTRALFPLIFEKKIWVSQEAIEKKGLQTVSQPRRKVATNVTHRISFAVVWH